MEDLLKELIAVNREMLNELKLLRTGLCQDAASPRELPVAEAYRLAQPDETGLPEPGRTAPPRYTPKDLEEIRGSLLEGLKKQNRDKSNAFAEFEKRHKEW
jgi:hypothetical protein